MQESKGKANFKWFPYKKNKLRRNRASQTRSKKTKHKTSRKGWWPKPPCKRVWHDTAKIYLGFIATTHILSSQFMDIELRDINDIFLWAS